MLQLGHSERCRASPSLAPTSIHKHWPNLGGPLALVARGPAEMRMLRFPIDCD